MRISLAKFGVAGLALLAVASSAGATDGIAWSSSFDAALARARQSRRLILADFYTDW